jgi:hypothetical protein
VLRRTFGLKRDEVTGGRRSILKMIKSRSMRWAGHVARIGAERNAYRTLVRKPEGKRPLGRPRHRWMDNIKIYLRETGWGGMDWTDLAQGRDQWRALVITAMNLLAGEFLSSCTTGGFSRRVQFHGVC